MPLKSRIEKFLARTKCLTPIRKQNNLLGEVERAANKDPSDAQLQKWLKDVQAKDKELHAADTKEGRAKKKLARARLRVVEVPPQPPPPHSSTGKKVQHETLRPSFVANLHLQQQDEVPAAAGVEAHAAGEAAALPLPAPAAEITSAELLASKDQYPAKRLDFDRFKELFLQDAHAKLLGTGAESEAHGTTATLENRSIPVAVCRTKNVVKKDRVDEFAKQFFYQSILSAPGDPNAKHFSRLYAWSTQEEDDGFRVYSASELGTPLDDFTNTNYPSAEGSYNSAMPTKFRQSVIRQILLAGQRLELLRLIHGDSKVENIIVTKDDEAEEAKAEEAVCKYIDYGCTKSLDDPPAKNVQGTELMFNGPAFFEPSQRAAEEAVLFYTCLQFLYRQRPFLRELLAKKLLGDKEKGCMCNYTSLWPGLLYDLWEDDAEIAAAITPLLELHQQRRMSIATILKCPYFDQDEKVGFQSKITKLKFIREFLIYDKEEIDFVIELTPKVSGLQKNERLEIDVENWPMKSIDPDQNALDDALKNVPDELQTSVKTHLQQYTGWFFTMREHKQKTWLTDVIKAKVNEDETFRTRGFLKHEALMELCQAGLISSDEWRREFDEDYIGMEWEDVPKAELDLAILYGIVDPAELGDGESAEPESAAKASPSAAVLGTSAAGTSATEAEQKRGAAGHEDETTMEVKEGSDLATVLAQLPTQAEEGEPEIPFNADGYRITQDGVREFLDYASYEASWAKAAADLKQLKEKAADEATLAQEEAEGQRRAAAKRRLVLEGPAKPGLHERRDDDEPDKGGRAKRAATGFGITPTATLSSEKSSAGKSASETKESAGGSTDVDALAPLHFAALSNETASKLLSAQVVVDSQIIGYAYAYAKIYNFSGSSTRRSEPERVSETLLAKDLASSDQSMLALLCSNPPCVLVEPIEDTEALAELHVAANSNEAAAKSLLSQVVLDNLDFGDDLESAVLSESRNTHEGQPNALRNAATAKQTFPQQDLASRIAVQSAQFAGPRGSLSVACLPHASPTDGSLSLDLFNAAAMADVVGVKSARPSFTSLSLQVHTQQPQQQQALLYPHSPQQQRVLASAVGLVSSGGVYALPAAQPFARSQSFAITSPNSSDGSVDWSRPAASDNAAGFETVGGNAASKSNLMTTEWKPELLSAMATTCSEIEGMSPHYATTVNAKVSMVPPNDLVADLIAQGAEPVEARAANVSSLVPTGTASNSVLDVNALAPTTPLEHDDPATNLPQAATVQLASTGSCAATAKQQFAPMANNGDTNASAKTVVKKQKSLIHRVLSVFRPKLSAQEKEDKRLKKEEKELIRSMIKAASKTQLTCRQRQILQVASEEGKAAKAERKRQKIARAEKAGNLCFETTHVDSCGPGVTSATGNAARNRGGGSSKHSSSATGFGNLNLFGSGSRPTAASHSSTYKDAAITQRLSDLRIAGSHSTSKHYLASLD